MFWMLVQGTLFVLITFIIESKLWRLLLCRRDQETVDVDNIENDLDEDVVEERRRVMRNTDSDVLTVKNLFKRYTFLLDRPAPILQSYIWHTLSRLF